MQDPPPVRFGVRNLMAYTLVCSVVFLLFSISQRANTSPPGVRDLIDLATVFACLIGLGVAGLGPEAFRVCFFWVGKVCLSLVAASIVSILVLSASRAIGLHNPVSLTLGGLTLLSITSAGIVMAIRSQ